ncbi:MAG: hypothetical protein QXW41_08520 [Fervidicoccaceae archaeon]
MSLQRRRRVEAPEVESELRAASAIVAEALHIDKKDLVRAVDRGILNIAHIEASAEEAYTVIYGSELLRALELAPAFVTAEEAVKGVERIIDLHSRGMIKDDRKATMAAAGLLEHLPSIELAMIALRGMDNKTNEIMKISRKIREEIEQNGFVSKASLDKYVAVLKNYDRDLQEIREISARFKANLRSIAEKAYESARTIELVRRLGYFSMGSAVKPIAELPVDGLLASKLREASELVLKGEIASATRIAYEIYNNLGSQAWIDISKTTWDEIEKRIKHIGASLTPATTPLGYVEDIRGFGDIAAVYIEKNREISNIISSCVKKGLSCNQNQDIINYLSLTNGFSEGIEEAMKLLNNNKYRNLLFPQQQPPQPVGLQELSRVAVKDKLLNSSGNRVFRRVLVDVRDMLSTDLDNRVDVFNRMEAEALSEVLAAVEDGSKMLSSGGWRTRIQVIASMLRTTFGMPYDVEAENRAYSAADAYIRHGLVSGSTGGTNASRIGLFTRISAAGFLAEALEKISGAGGEIWFKEFAEYEYVNTKKKLVRARLPSMMRAMDRVTVERIVSSIDEYRGRMASRIADVLGKTVRDPRDAAAKASTEALKKASEYLGTGDLHLLAVSSSVYALKRDRDIDASSEKGWVLSRVVVLKIDRYSGAYQVATGDEILDAARKGVKILGEDPSSLAGGWVRVEGDRIAVRPSIISESIAEGAAIRSSGDNVYIIIAVPEHPTTGGQVVLSDSELVSGSSAANDPFWVEASKAIDSIAGSPHTANLAIALGTIKAIRHEYYSAFMRVAQPSASIEPAALAASINMSGIVSLSSAAKEIMEKEGVGYRRALEKAIRRDDVLRAVMPQAYTYAVAVDLAKGFKAMDIFNSISGYTKHIKDLTRAHPRISPALERALYTWVAVGGMSLAVSPYILMVSTNLLAHAAEWMAPGITIMNTMLWQGYRSINPDRGIGVATRIAGDILASRSSPHEIVRRAVERAIRYA